MAKNDTIRVNLLFDANTTAAKNNITALAAQLKTLSIPKGIVVNGGNIDQAAKAAQQLTMHLEKATNVNTGKLDLSKFNSSLRNANTSISELSTNLLKGGIQGEQAFARLANQIAQAQVPTNKLSGVIGSLMKTLGNAILWNTAYGAINMVTKSFSSAVTYAKDLNKALNDIQIVSNLSSKSLENFARDASKAAKALNTTTTEYAKAALIFYQQGLSGDKVLERANVVTKMAQVTGEAAQSISDQLTAVWNNFDNGTKSLEYYADALTALGAATAASTSDITQGLEKFAAVAETVGLSFEYATAALATVVDNTKQSADVVGTAFKTLFARLQDLDLGQTLDDGVTIGKYSAALEAVGVQVLDTNGELRSMNQILDDLGSKWNVISDAQKVALAQTVAGTRQYTQLISLMDNYSEFKINVDIATSAEGTLTEQWKIWETSYKASAERMKQASNELYEKLLNDKAVIGFTDTITSLTNVIADVIDTFGGLGPLLLTLAGIFSSKLMPLITRAGNSVITWFENATGIAARKTAQMQQEMKAEIDKLAGSGKLNPLLMQQLTLSKELITAKERMAALSKNLTASQMEEYQMHMSVYEATNLELQEKLKLMKANSDAMKQSKAGFVLRNRGAIRKAAKATHDAAQDQKVEEQVQNNDKVKAAQATYDEAQQKAVQMRKTFSKVKTHSRGYASREEQEKAVLAAEAEAEKKQRELQATTGRVRGGYISQKEQFTTNAPTSRLKIGEVTTQADLPMADDSGKQNALTHAAMNNLVAGMGGQVQKVQAPPVPPEAKEQATVEVTTFVDGIGNVLQGMVDQARKGIPTEQLEQVETTIVKNLDEAAQARLKAKLTPASPASSTPSPEMTPEQKRFQQLPQFKTNDTVDANEPMAYGKAIDKFGGDKVPHGEKGKQFREAVIGAPSNAAYNQGRGAQHVPLTLHGPATDTATLGDAAILETIAGAKKVEDLPAGIQQTVLGAKPLNTADKLKSLVGDQLGMVQGQIKRDGGVSGAMDAQYYEENSAAFAGLYGKTSSPRKRESDRVEAYTHQAQVQADESVAAQPGGSPGVYPDSALSKDKARLEEVLALFDKIQQEKDETARQELVSQAKTKVGEIENKEVRAELEQQFETATVPGKKVTNQADIDTATSKADKIAQLTDAIIKMQESDNATTEEIRKLIGELALETGEDAGELEKNLLQTKTVPAPAANAPAAGTPESMSAEILESYSFDTTLDNFIMISEAIGKLAYVTENIPQLITDFAGSVQNLGVEMTEAEMTDEEVAQNTDAGAEKLAAAYDEKTTAEMTRDQLRGEVEKLKSNIANGTSTDAAADAQALQEKTAQLSAAETTVQQKTQAVQTAAEGVDKKTATRVAGIKQYEAELKKLGAAAGIPEERLKGVSKILNNAALTGKMSKKGFGQVTEAMKDVGDTSRMAGMKLQETQTQMRDQLAETTKTSGEELDDLAGHAEQAGHDMAEMSAKAGAVKLPEPPPPTAWQSFSNGLQSVATAAGNVTMLINGVRQLSSAFEEGKSPMESIMAVLMSMSMILPAIIALGGIKIKQDEKGNAVTLGSVVAKWLKVGATNAETASEIASTVAAWPKLVVTLLLMAAFIALAAIILIVASAYNKEAKEAKAAAETAKQLQEEYEATKQAYEDLKSSLENHNDALKAIETLKEGTIEWRQAIMEANEAVIELLNKYPELSKYVTRENGILKISEEGQDWVLNQQLNEMQTKQTAAGWANLYADQKAAAANRTDLLKNGLDTEKEGETFAKNAWTIVGTSLMALVPGLQAYAAHYGTAMIADQWAQNAREAAESEAAYDRMAEMYDQMGEEMWVNYHDNQEQFFKDLDIDPNGELAEAINNNIEAIQEQTRTTAELAEQEKLLLHQEATNALLAAGVNTESQAMGAKMQERADAAYEKIKSKYLVNTDDMHYSWIWSEHGTQEGEDLAKRYAEIMGYKDFDVQDFQGDRIKFKYIDENGDKQKGKFIDYKTMAETVAQHDANTIENQQLLADTVNAQMNVIRNLQQSADSKSQALGSFLAEGDFSLADLSSDDYSEMISMLQGSGEELTKIADEFYNGEINRLKSDLIKALELYNPIEAAEKRRIEDMRQAKAILEANAEALGVSVDALDVYAESLYNSSEALKDNRKAAAEAAVQHFKLGNGLKKMREIFKENCDILDASNKGTLDYAVALGELKTSMEETFGVEVSAETIENNLDKIEAAANGDVEALEALQQAVNEDFILNLNLDSSVKNVLINTLDEMSELAKNHEIGATLDLDTTSMAAMNEALLTGAMTLDQLKAMFANADISLPEPNAGTKIQKTTSKSSVVTTRYEVKDDGTKGNRRDAWIDETSITNENEIPYVWFGDEEPTFHEETGEVLSYGGGSSSIKASVNGSSSTKVSALNYGVDKKAEAEAKKKVTEEVERYHEITQSIEQLERELDNLSKKKDRAFGQKHLDYLDAEIAKNEELTAALEQRLAEEEAYLEKDAAAMKKYGMSTDENGLITNYDEVVAAQVAQYNKNPEKYQEEYDEFKENLSRYEETLQKVKDTREKLDDQAYKRIEQALETVEYKIELEVRLSDIDQKVIDFTLDNLEDSAEDAAKKFALMGKQFSNQMRIAETSASGIEDVLRVSGVEVQDVLSMSKEELKQMLENTEISEDQIAALEDHYDTLVDATSQMKELYDSISDDLVAAFEAGNEEMDKQIEKLEHMNSIAESFYNLIDLAGKESLGIDRSILTAIRQTQMEVAADAASSKKAKLESSMARLAIIEADRDKATTEEEKKEWQEAYDEILATVQSDQQEYLDSLSSGLESATALFQQQMDNTIGTFEDAMTGAYGTFAALQESFDQSKELDDRYLDDYQKIYELSKLNRDIIKSIDENDSIKAKERLRDLQKEINDLQEGNTEMTQFEVDALRAKYDLRLAEIALEEAQNAKSQVRMQRDSEGNWGYVYTADQNAIDGAQQNYEDKLYGYQNLLQKNIDEMQARLVQIPAEYAEAIRAIYEDQTLSDEERMLRIMEIQDYYQGMYDYVVTELGDSLDASNLLYEEDWTNYAKMTGYKLSVNEEWVSSFDETIAAQKLGLGSLTEAEERFKSASAQVLQSTTKEYEAYRENVKAILEDAIGDVEAFFGSEAAEGTLAYYLELMRHDSEEVKETVKEMGEENVNAFKNAANAAAENLEKYGNALKSWKEKTEEVGQAITTLANEYARLNGEIEKNQRLGGYDGTATEGLETITSTKPNNSSKTGVWQLGTAANSGATQFTVASNAPTVTRDGISYVKVQDNEGQQYWVKEDGLNGRRYTQDKSTGSRTYSLDHEDIMGYSIDNDGQMADPEGKNESLYREVKPTNQDAQRLLNVQADQKRILNEKIKAIKDYINSKQLKVKYVSETAKLHTFYPDSDTYLGFDQYSTGRRTEYVKGSEHRVTGYAYGTDAAKSLFVNLGDRVWTKGKNERIWQYVTVGEGNSFMPCTEKDETAIAYLKKPESFNTANMDKIKGFDTGGYTGSWDSSGRLAMLHQKELVLNAADTKNFLSAIDILRDITSIIDLQAVAQSQGLSALAQAPNVTTPTTQLQQEVTIHAEFPNAINRSEIEAAFGTLLNSASQFANRKNK